MWMESVFALHVSEGIHENTENEDEIKQIIERRSLTRRAMLKSTHAINRRRRMEQEQYVLN